ncbi:MAG: hydrolase [Candidatus Melainabacteria bacterium]
MASRLLNRDEACLLVIDVQEKLLPVMYGVDLIVERCLRLVQASGILGLPVIVTEQYPQGLGPTAPALAEALPPGSPVYEKTTFSSLGNPQVAAHLKTLGRRQVIVCGIESHVCVNQSVHTLLAEGCEVHVVLDAIGSRDKKNHKAAVAKMTQSGAIPASSEAVLFELCRDAKDPAFKALHSLIK